MRSTVCQNPATSCSVLALSRTAAGTLLVLSWIAMRSSHVDLDRRVTLSWIAVGPLALSWIAVGSRTLSWIAIGPLTLSWIVQCRTSRFVPDSCRIPLLALS